jgi:hypothetical protein
LHSYFTRGGGEWIAPGHGGLGRKRASVSTANNEVPE